MVSLLGFSVQSEGVNTVQFSLLMEFAELGSLDWYLHSYKGTIGWDIKSKMISDVASGLNFLHENNIVHNDVKAANVLVFRDVDIMAKITDFGLVVPIKEPPTVVGPGHRRWAAPEIWGGKTIAPATPSRDVYSFGLLVWYMALETDPFRSQRDDEICQKKYANGFVNDILEELVEAPSPIREILKGTLQIDLENRFGNLKRVNEILKGGLVDISVPRLMSRKGGEIETNKDWLVTMLRDRDERLTHDREQKVSVFEQVPHSCNLANAAYSPYVSSQWYIANRHYVLATT